MIRTRQKCTNWKFTALFQFRVENHFSTIGIIQPFFFTAALATKGWFHALV